MESSPNNTPAVPPTVYRRSDSEVVEKPEFHGSNEYGTEDDFMALFDGDNMYPGVEEVRVVESSQAVPCYSPQSQCSTPSSSKGDYDGSSDELGGQGDVDEGFEDDEEMEEKDTDAGPAPSIHTINQLLTDDNVNLNSQLDSVATSIPNTTLFDDFDFGVSVDVLDSELQVQTTEPIKSPVPSSPYHFAATSPATVATTDMQLMSLNERNEYLSQEHSSSPSSSSVHSHQSIFHEDNLSALLTEDMTCVSSYNPQFTQPSTVSGNDYHPFSCANSSYPNTTYTHSQQCTVSSSTYNPTLTSVNLSLLNDPIHLMDLTEASKLVSTESGAMMLDTCYGGNPASVPVMTTTSTTILTNRSSHPYIENTIPQASLNNIMVNVPTEGVDTCSRGSQTPGTSTTSGTHDARRSLSPAPNHSHPNYPSPVSPSYSTTNSGACYYPSLPSPHSPASSYTSLSPGPEEVPLSPEKRRIVEMPFNQFKKYLDDPSIPEKEKEDMKNIRRRGKNKVAAKNCRKKKLSVLCGLQQEVDQLKSALTRHSQKSRSLQQEIAFYKARCTRTHGPIALSRKQN